MFFMLTLGSTKKSCVVQKTVASTKKIFHVELMLRYKIMEPQKNMLWRQKKLCDTQKKTHVD